MQKIEVIQKVNDFLETTPDEFVKDTLELIILTTENVLDEHVEADYSSRDAVLEQINTLLLELPLRSIKHLPVSLIAGFVVFRQLNKEA